MRARQGFRCWFGIACAGLNDGELVAAEPRHQITLAHATQAIARLTCFSSAVADRMAEAVVDGLEAVEVEAEHGEALAAREALQGIAAAAPGTSARLARPVRGSWRASRDDFACPAGGAFR